MNVACVESMTTGLPATSARPMQALASSRSAASISPTRTMTVAGLLRVDPDGSGRGRVLDQRPLLLSPRPTPHRTCFPAG